MKILSGMRGIANLQVVFGGELQKTFEAAAGMFGALPFVAVWQEEHDPAHPLPFRFGADNELIDDRLRAIGEIAKLRLPHDKRPRVGRAKAVLEPEHAQLGKHGVDDGEAAL